MRLALGNPEWEWMVPMGESGVGSRSMGFTLVWVLGNESLWDAVFSCVFYSP